MRRRLALPVLGSLLLLAACGGGNNSSTSTPRVSYVGVTAQAAFTPANTRQLVVGAVNGGMAGQNIISPLDTTATAAKPSPPFLLSLPEELQSPVVASLPTRAVPTLDVSRSFTGSCGGEAVGNLNVNDLSGSFTGTVDFSDYCEAGQTLAGSVPVSGSLDLSTLALQHLTLTPNALRVTDSATGTVQTLTGTITLDISADGLTDTVLMDLVLQDQTSGKTYWANNYRLTIVSDAAGNSDTTASGRYYDHDNGYVNFTTITPLHLDAAATGPTSGELSFTGTSATSARLTVQSDGSYLIEADTTGDGTYDFNTTYTP